MSGFFLLAIWRRRAGNRSHFETLRRFLAIDDAKRGIA
jgi:hypothetical protein